MVQVSGLFSLKQLIKKQIRKIENFGIQRIPYKILNVFPHDSKAFTQGLFFSSGLLYESTGLIGESSLRCVEPESGRIIKKIAIQKEWAEGVALINEQVIQLTWKSHKAFRYSFPELIYQGDIPIEEEGWGLGTWSDSLVMTNGGSSITFRDGSLEILKKINVTKNGVSQKNLNDLDALNGKLYVNVWYRDEILEVDPDSGVVTGILDCSPLVNAASPTDQQAVLNGIACDPKSQTIFVTGKQWPLLFQLQLI